MGFEKILTWCLTETGRKCVFYLAGASSTSVMLGHILPNTIFLEQYKDFVRLYRNGFTVPVSKELTDRFNKALELCQVEPADRHLFQPFNVVGFDIFSAGSAYSKFGAIIGLPANFSYKKESDIDRSRIKINHESVLWDTDEGQNLLNSLILSEDAQLYAIAKEIKIRETPKFLLDAAYATLAVSGYYGITNYINRKLNLYIRPLVIRAVMYSLVGIFTVGCYAFLKDFTQVAYEQALDKDLVLTDKIFLEGGKEYYAKVLQKNVALRKLLGKEGEKLYSPLGNENYFLRYKHTPLIQRKEFFETA